MNNEEPIMDDLSLAPEPDFLTEQSDLAEPLSEAELMPTQPQAEPQSATGIFQRADGRVIESLVLHELPPEALPTVPTACQVCPNTMWLQQDDNGELVLQNYCTIMNRIIWQSNNPVEVLNCDGLVMNLED